MAVRLNRLLGPASRLSAGEWSSETASGEPCVACPDCGERGELEIRKGRHRVLNGGQVSPIWCCPGAACAFRDFLHLEAYGEEYVR